MCWEGIIDDGYILGNIINIYFNEFVCDFDFVCRMKFSIKVVKVECIFVVLNLGWRLVLVESLEVIECCKLIYVFGVILYFVMFIWLILLKFLFIIIYLFVIGIYFDILFIVCKVVVVGVVKLVYDIVFLFLSNGI